MACSIESIRTWTAPISRASLRPRVVLPAPGRPLRMMRVGVPICMPFHVDARRSGQTLELAVNDRERGSLSQGLEAPMQDLMTRLSEAALTGMTATVWADVKGSEAAIHDPFGTRTFSELNQNANRIVRALRARGLAPGDSVALMCSNRAEFAEVLSAALRGGFRVTPVNWHLTTDEVAYIINDCEAKALFAETRFLAAVAAETPNLEARFSIGADAPGFIPYGQAL